MGPGTKNRQAQVAEQCRAYLRRIYFTQAALVEEFIREIEGPEEEADVTRWGRFTDPSRSVEAMLRRVEGEFKEWLGGA